MRYELIKNQKIGRINNDKITIFFEDEEVEFMKEMLEIELEEEFKEAEKLIKKMMKAIKDKNAKKLYDIEDKDYCLTSPHFTQEEIDILLKEKKYTISITLLRYRFIEKIVLIENRKFIEGFKEVLRFAIEEDEDCFKERYLQELAEI